MSMPFPKGHKGLRKHYTKRVENVCSVCGKSELRRPCEVTPYCGAECYHRSRSGFRPKEITKPCAQCGAYMTNYVSQIGTYCSRSCADEAKKVDAAFRFWPRVAKSDGCWLWTGPIGTDGYGKFWMNKSMRHASRVAYELVNGPIANPSSHVCHTCDTPLCVRPDHLFLGTHSDNMADRNAKGRTMKGSRHAHAKINEADVLMIRAAHSAGVSTSDIAKRFGMSKSNAHGIISKRLWKHVT